MSHWTTVKTSIKNLKILEKTLKEIRPTCTVAKNSNVRGFSGRQQKADVVLVAPGGQRYDIGFQKQKDDSFAIVADWWGATQWAGNQQEFTDELNQKYTKNVILDKAKQLGWFKEKEEQGEEIVIELTQY